MFDIKWHDAKDEMPGNKFETSSGSFHEFIVRYTFEDDDDNCCIFFEIATLRDGVFVPNFDDWPDEDRERVQKEARVLHWAYLDHPSDYE